MQEFTSKHTSVNKNKIPAIFKKIDWNGGINLDYGGGSYDTATEYLKQFGTINLIYDPYNRSYEHNQMVMSHIGEFKSATVSNVLNVIKEPEARRALYKDLKFKLAPGTPVYFYIYEGNKSGIGKITKKDCWQNNCRASFYLTEISEFFSNCIVHSQMICATA